MTEELPTPASRKESYLAKAAGMAVTIPDKPESRIEQYLNAIANNGGGGGGGSYTAGDGINIANNTISVDTTEIQEKLTAGTNITISNNVISAAGGEPYTTLSTSDYNYPTNNPNRVMMYKLDSGLYYVPDDVNYGCVSGENNSDWGHFVLVAKAATNSSRGEIYDFCSNPNAYTGIDQNGSNSTKRSLTTDIVQSTGTSTSTVMSQKAVTDELFPQYSSKSKGVIGIGNYSSIANYGDSKIGIGNITLGNQSAYALAINSGDSGGTVNSISGIGIWAGAGGTVTGASGIAIGNGASVSGKGAIAIGNSSSASTQGEFNIGTSNTEYGYNNTNYRLISGVHDGQNAHDAATVGQAVGTTESYTIASASWTALSASSPYTYSATVTATYTIGNNTIAELINDNAVAFSNYGFSIGSISGQNVTIYSIGQPSASVTLKVNYKG